MRSGMMKLTGAVVAAATLLAVIGCATSRRPTVPEEDLTPFQQLVAAWTQEYSFRRTSGGDDLVSHSDAIIERPSHEERLTIRATLFADTLVSEEIATICIEDTTGVGCDSIRSRYTERHNYPEQFRIEIQAYASLPDLFTLEPLTIYITDQNDIDYEPSERVFSDTHSEQRSYLDREVTRYDPYTSYEYRVYEYQHGYEFASSGHATLYFRRTNVIGRDILSGDDAKLKLTMRRGRMNIASLRWNLAEIAEFIQQDSPPQR